MGEKIKKARLERGLTQKQLVGKVITRNMLSKIENDNATPSIRTLNFLAERLSLPLSYLLEDTAYSDGSSPDGLDEMRRAYKEGRYTDCIKLLEKDSTVATTDEGYLLYAISAVAAAQEALSSGDFETAKYYADSSDYYNKEGLYYSKQIDAEMSLILCECAVELDVSEFDHNASEYERVVKGISYSDRYVLARAAHLIETDELVLAERLLFTIMNDKYKRARYHYLLGKIKKKQQNHREASELLVTAEKLCAEKHLLHRIYFELEEVYVALENYQLAHKYASMQVKK